MTEDRKRRQDEVIRLAEEISAGTTGLVAGLAITAETVRERLAEACHIVGLASYRGESGAEMLARLASLLAFARSAHDASGGVSFGRFWDMARKEARDRTGFEEASGLRPSVHASLAVILSTLSGRVAVFGPGGPHEIPVDDLLTIVAGVALARGVEMADDACLSGAFSIARGEIAEIAGGAA